MNECANEGAKRPREKYVHLILKALSKESNATSERYLKIFMENNYIRNMLHEMLKEGITVSIARLYFFKPNLSLI